MKKLKLLILFYLSILYLPLMAQVSTGQEQEFDYGIKNNASQTVTSPNYLVTQGIDGTQGRMAGSFLDIKTENSAGAIQGFTLTNNGNGTVNISSGTAYLRPTNDPYSSLIKYTIPGVTNLALTDNANNFILVDYNSGTPALTVTTNTATINTTTNSIALVISRVGNTLDYLSLVGQNVDANAKLRVRFLNQEGIRRANGANIGFINRNLTLTAGTLFSGLIRVNTPAFNTVSPDTFTQVYNNGAVWTRTTGQTQVNNTQYNNAGVLTNLGVGDYRTDFIYLLPNNPSKLYLVLGTSSYANIGLARGATAPSILPSELQSLGLLVGRSIIQRLGASISEVASAFDVVFTTTPISDHNSLSGIQGGAANDYQHLTTTQLNDIAYKSGTTFTGAVNVLTPTTGTQAVNKDYADGLLVGLWNDRGNYNPSSNSNQYPTTGGSGTAGAIVKGNAWQISGLGAGVSALIGTKTVNDGDVVRALISSPGQTDTNWAIAENNIGFTPANDANVIHTTGNESFSGVKSSVNTGSSQVNGLSLTNNSTAGPVLSIGNSSTGNGVTLSNTGNGDGININNVTGDGRGLVITNQSAVGRGIEVTNTNSAIGIRVNNNFSGLGQTFENNSSGTALRLNSATASTGDLLTFTKNLSAPITKVDQNGIMTTPTPTAGDNTTRVATTAFVTGALANYVTTNTSQSITAAKNMSIINITRSNSDFNGINLSGQRSGAQAGLIDITNSNSGFGYRYDGTGGGVGFSGANVTGPVFSATGNATSSGHLFTANSLSGSTSLLYHGSNQSGTVFQVNNLGNITGNSFIKTGGTASQYLMADGSVSTLTNPITGTGTLNYLPKFTASGKIGISQVFDNGTNVGIGTVTPNVGKIQVQQTSTSLPAAYLYNPNTVSGSSRGLVVEAGTDSSDYSVDFRNSVGTSFFKILGNGNVGIGTVIPKTTLNLNKASQIYSSATPSGALIISDDINTVRSLELGTDTTNGIGYLQARHLTTSTWYNLALNPNGGNVGIGTTNPLGVTHIVTNSATPNLYLEKTTTNVANILFKGATSFSLIDAGDNFDIYTNETLRTRITKSGNVLVKTPTDNGVDALQVNGTISTTGIKSIQFGVGDLNSIYASSPDNSVSNVSINIGALTTNRPADNVCNISMHKINSTAGSMTAIDLTNSKFYVRTLNTTWSAWVEK